MEISCSLCHSTQIIIKFINYELNRVMCGIPKLGNEIKVMFIIDCEDCGNKDNQWVVG